MLRPEREDFLVATDRSGIVPQFMEDRAFVDPCLDRKRVARRASPTRADRRSEETVLSGPAPASPVRLRLHVPGTRLAPFPGQLVVRLQGERSIVRLEGIAEPLELLQGDALPRPRVRVAGLPLDRLFVPEETHLRIPALHRQLRELQEDVCVLFLRPD